MAKRKRLKREVPTQSAPVRNSMTGAPSAMSPTGPFTLSDAMDQSLRAAQRLTQTADATMKGAVERGVDTAYMVIEEYMRRGQEAASRFRQRNGRSDMNDEQQRFGGPFANPSGPMAPLMAPWIQAMRVWTDAMASFAAGGGPAVDMMNRVLAGFALARPKISVEVSSEYPTELIVALDPGAELAKLTVDPLSNPDNRDAPALAGTQVECLQDVIRFRLTIPNDQPAGKYCGTIKDSAGLRRGELVAHVKGPAAPPAPRSRGRKAK